IASVWRACSGSTTGSRSTRRGPSACTATTRCRSSIMVSSSAASTPRPIAPSAASRSVTSTSSRGSPPRRRRLAGGTASIRTRRSDLDGTHGRLAYAGYDIEDLARRATFEEVCHLLWWGELPTAAQLDKTTLALIAARAIPKELIQAFGLVPKDTDPMRVLQAAVAMLGMRDPDATDNSRSA